jgi:hypothetical protein
MRRLRAPLRAAGVVAIAFGLVSFAITWTLASDGTESAASVFAAARVPLLWCVVMVGAGVVLLLVSALVTGDTETVE